MNGYWLAFFGIIVGAAVAGGFVWNIHNWQQYDFQIRVACIQQGGIFDDSRGNGRCMWSRTGAVADGR